MPAGRAHAGRRGGRGQHLQLRRAHCPPCHSGVPRSGPGHGARGPVSNCATGKCAGQLLLSGSFKGVNAYARLFSKLRRYMPSINIVTLNYDLLIEQALLMNGFLADYSGNGRVFNSQNGHSSQKAINLLKIHGSSNFLPVLPKGTIMRGCVSDGGPAHVHTGEMIFAKDADQISDWCSAPENDSLSPMLALYQADKRIIINPFFVQGLLSKYNLAIGSSKLIVLVGIEYIPHDEHVWQVIEQSGASILIVNPSPDKTMKWVLDCEIPNVSFITKDFYEALPEIVRNIRQYYLTPH